MNSTQRTVAFAFRLAGLALSAASLALLVLGIEGTAIATVAVGVFSLAIAGLLQNPLR